MLFCGSSGPPPKKGWSARRPLDCYRGCQSRHRLRLRPSGQSHHRHLQHPSRCRSRCRHIAAQVEALRRAQQAVLVRRDLMALQTSSMRDSIETQKENYLLRLRWPAACLILLLVFYVAIGWLWLPRMRKNESLFLARRLSRYLHFLAAVGIVAGFFFDDLSMVAAAFGLVSAALVIALKDVFTSITAWFVSMVGGKMRIGDRLEVDGVKGDIIDIDLLRTTMLEVNGWLGADQPTGRVISMPNNFIFTQKVFNYSHGHPYIWCKVEFTVTIATPVAEAVEMFTRVLEEETRTQFAEARLGASAIRQRYGVEDAVYEPRVRLQVGEQGVIFSLFYVAHYRDIAGSRTRLTTRMIRELEKTPRVQLSMFTTVQLVDDRQGSAKGPAPSALWTKPPAP